MMFALSGPDMPSMRKYAIGNFHDPFIETAIRTNASLANGAGSSWRPFPMSTTPEYSPLTYSTCRLMAISSSMSAHTVRLSFIASAFTCAAIAVNAHCVNPGSPSIPAYQVRMCRGWGNANLNVRRSRMLSPSRSGVLMRRPSAHHGRHAPLMAVSQQANAS